jgi:histidine triad (HIT) family protein
MCLFCKIVRREIPAKILFEEEDLLAFADIAPKAPTHALDEAESTDATLLGKMLIACQRVAREAGISSTGFRVVANAGPDAGQTVFHLHFHVLGGRSMAWPPG